MFLGINLPWKKLPSGDVQFGGAVDFGGRISVNGRTPRTVDRPLRGATIGDSMGTVRSNTSDTDLELMTYTLPASSYTYVNYGRIQFSVAHKLECMAVADGGIGTVTVASILARGTSAYAANRKAMADVAKKRPDFVLVHCGINSLTAIAANPTEALIAAIADDYAEICRYFAGKGIFVVSSGYCGYSGADANAANIKASGLRLNALITAAAAGNPDWRHIKTLGVLHAADGTYNAADTFDGVHLSYIGAAKLGALEAAAINSVFASNLPSGQIWDEQDDFASAASAASYPRYITQATSGCTVASIATTADKCVVTVNVTAFATANLLLTKNSLLAFAGVADKQRVLLRYNIDAESDAMEDGDFVRAENRVLLYANDNSGYLFYATSDDTASDAAKIQQLYFPIAAADLGSSSSIATKFLFPKNGTYRITLRPRATYLQ